MIHGRRVSHRDCVTCQWVATRRGRTTSSEEDILYLCICLYFELKTQTRDNRHPSLTHIRPLCWSWRRHARVKRARQHIHPQPETIRGTRESALLIIFACFLSGGWHIPEAHAFIFTDFTWNPTARLPGFGSTGCLKHSKLIMSFSLISVPSMSFV